MNQPISDGTSLPQSDGAALSSNRRSRRRLVLSWVVGSLVGWALALSLYYGGSGGLELIRLKAAVWIDSELIWVLDAASAYERIALYRQIGNLASNIRVFLMHHRYGIGIGFDLMTSLPAVALAGIILGSFHRVVLGRYIAWPRVWPWAFAGSLALGTATLLLPCPLWVDVACVVPALGIQWVALRGRVRWPVAWTGLFLVSTAIVLVPTYVLVFLTAFGLGEMGIDVSGWPMQFALVGGISGVVFGLASGALTVLPVLRLCRGPGSSVPEPGAVH